MRIIAARRTVGRAVLRSLPRWRCSLEITGSEGGPAAAAVGLPLLRRGCRGLRPCQRQLSLQVLDLARHVLEVRRVAGTLGSIPRVLLCARAQDRPLAQEKPPELVSQHRHTRSPCLSARSLAGAFQLTRGGGVIARALSRGRQPRQQRPERDAGICCALTSVTASASAACEACAPRRPASAVAPPRRRVENFHWKSALEILAQRFLAVGVP